ncbi:hypothetical protein AVEN_153005-1 [Araneus ventricosus]|uniref:Uncharacterized protein n=1 Tax=Araneus ventricosus TaxID=182803 RepID=A0A4Y2ADG9_ARAVE|nr:hypothetical protein AVEN_153005-1 [Araneus ventricosus]
MLWVMPVVLNKTQWIYPVGAGARRSFGVPGGPISPPVPLALNPLGGRFRHDISYALGAVLIQGEGPEEYVIEYASRHVIEYATPLLNVKHLQ